jgi:methylisocitrate lyase
MSKASENRRALKRLLAQGGTLAVPGAYDPLSAMLIQRAGFLVVYVGSYATAAALSRLRRSREALPPRLSVAIRRA